MDAGSLLHMVTEPTRRAILQELRGGPRQVTTLAGAVGHDASNVSHHLRLLRDAGIVRGQAQGRERWYRLADPEVAAVLDRLSAAAGDLARAAYASQLHLPTGVGFHGYG